MKESTYKNYLLTVLMVILTFNYADRYALALLLQDIRADLGLSDTQLGLLSGIAFALFYSLMGIPLARWADRGNRVTIITLTTALWSAAVALCGAATSFLQLLLIRVAAGVGEAGCIPTAHSLIADYYKREDRPRATSRYMLGIPLSVVFSSITAGWLNELYGWRIAFIALGVPGIGLAAIAWMTLREPRRERSAPARTRSSPYSLGPTQDDPSRPDPSLGETWKALWVNRTFRHLLLGFSVANFFGYGLTQWKPAFFIRSFGLNTGEVGTWFAAIYGACGLLGLYWGGELASRRAAANEALQLKGMACGYSCFAFISGGMFVASNPHLAFALMGLATVGIYTTTGPLFATIQTLVPEHMRAMSVALIYLFANLIGMGFGPLAAGFLSDAFRSWAGEESLRYALLVLCPGYFWAGWHLWRASKSIGSDLPSVQGDRDRITGLRSTSSDVSRPIHQPGT